MSDTGWDVLDEAALAAARRESYAAARRLRLPLGRQAWRGPTGAARGRDLGNSIELHDHRAYIPGDDPRHIHWAAYARTGQLLMKLFRAEAAPWVEVGFDASVSMALDAAKARRSAELLGWAVAAADAAAAPVRVYAAMGRRVVAIDPALVRAGRWRDGLAAAGSGDEASSGPAGAADEERARASARAPADVSPGPWPWRPGGLRVIISDLLFSAEPGPWLAAVAGGAGCVIGLVPWCAAEASPDWRGNLDMADVESRHVRRQRVDAGIRAAYAAAYRRHFAAWGEAARRRGVLLARVPSSGSLAEALAGEARALGAVEVAA